MAVQQFRQEIFVDGYLSTLESGQLALIVVHQNYVVTKVGEAGACDQSHVSGTHDSNPHFQLRRDLETTATLDVSAKLRGKIYLFQLVPRFSLILTLLLRPEDSSWFARQILLGFLDWPIPPPSIRISLPRLGSSGEAGVTPNDSECILTTSIFGVKLRYISILSPGFDLYAG
jgi:hypothetical protein